jgi:hypothetical protein
MSEERPPDNLEYRDWNLDKPARKALMAQFIGGIVIGAMLVGIVGVVGFFGVLPLGLNASSTRFRVGLTVAFGCITLIGAVAARPLWLRRRYTLAGALCGAAVVGLCEGLCFGIG